MRLYKKAARVDATPFVSMSSGNDLKCSPKSAVVDLEFIMDVIEYDADEDDCRRALKDARNYTMTDYLDNPNLTARDKKYMTLRNKILEDFKELLRFREQCEIEGPDPEEEEEKRDEEKPVEEKQDTEQSEKQFMDSFHTLYF